MTKLNRIGATLAGDADVHAMTDVTGFGLLGHALEMAEGSQLSVSLDWAALPFLTEAENFARMGAVTGASHRNWASYGHHVILPAGFPDWKRHLLTDPQTSGGLLVACAAARADDVVAAIIAAGCPAARIIGAVGNGPAAVGGVA